jgi:hypothetical protein
MDVLLREDPELFETYALTDAVICVRYAEHMIALNEETAGGRELPVTLTSIGTHLLLKMWEAAGIDRLAVLGKETSRCSATSPRIASNAAIGLTKAP